MSDIDNTIYYLKREQEEKYAKEKAASLKIPYADLTQYPIISDILNTIPEQDVIRYRLVPYLKIGSELKIGAVDPTNKQLRAYIEDKAKSMGSKISVALISKTSFMCGVSCYQKRDMEEMSKAEEKLKKDEGEKESLKIVDIQSAAEAAKQSSTTQLLETIFRGAINLKASDIHFEPGEGDFLIRYRIDGVLQDVVHLPLLSFKQIVSRIKFLAKLRMDISNAPQDGRFSLELDEKLDLRVSIMPSAFGESIVLRLLGQEKSILRLDSLGFRSDALATIRNAISKPHGMILTSGPTGSGKTSTLYALITELKKPGVKIITLEDPIEYRIEGVEQSQVRPDQGYDFANGLRASLRQDPDILMVGEIRDAETAKIAIESALTGHLLLSTIHANSAPAVFVRLLEIGVKPFLMSGSINLIMAQRLVRTICPDCQEEYVPSPEIWQAVLQVLTPVKSSLPSEIAAKLIADPPKLRRGKGCPKCNNSGFSGRQVIVETLVPSAEIQTLIAKSASIAEFEAEAKRAGMITMEQDGLVKALSSSTTIEEVWRVTRG